MKNIKSNLILSVTIIFIVCLFVAPISLAAANKAKLSSSLTMISPMSRGLEIFKEYVEEKTNGEVEIVIYPSSQLGAERESVEQVKTGLIELAVACVGPMTTFNKNFMLLDIPFLFDSYYKAWMTCDSPVGQKILDSSRDYGLVGLAYMTSGFRHVTNNVRPIKTVEDFKNLKIRTMEAPMHMKNFKALGCNPTPVSWTELYMTLQQGVVDGQENPFYNIWEAKLYEAQKYLSLTKHIYDSIILVANPDWFDNLTMEQQMIVKKGAVLGQNYGRFLNKLVEDKMQEKLIELGMTINDIEPEEIKRMKETSQNVVIEAIKEKGVDKNLINEWLETIDQVDEQFVEIVEG